MARRQMLTEDERRSRLVDADGREPQHAPPRRQAPKLGQQSRRSAAGRFRSKGCTMEFA
jgi:hypothetical protein